jgi:hypothetical protein
MPSPTRAPRPPAALALLLWAAGSLALALPACAPAQAEEGCPPSALFSGASICRLHGKVKYVTAFPDYKIQLVTAFPDIKVQKVTAFPDGPGKWQVVDAFPDFKVQVVNAFPDFKVQYVTAFPGCP